MTSMSTTPGKRTRSERVAALQLDTFSLQLWWDRLTSGPAILRIALTCLFVAIAALVLRGWDPPFTYRLGYIPPRDIISREKFEMFDATKTQLLMREARQRAICVYENRPQPLKQLRGAIKDQLFGLLSVNDVSSMDKSQSEALSSFIKHTEDEPEISPEDALKALKTTFAEEGQQEKFDKLLLSIFEDYEKYGLLRSLTHEEGRQDWIHVIQADREKNVSDAEDPGNIQVFRVRIVEVLAELKKQLRSDFLRDFSQSQPDSGIVAGLLYNYVAARLPETLTLRQDLSEEARTKAMATVPKAMTSFFPSTSTLARAGVPLQLENLKVLRAEHDQWLSRLTIGERLMRLAAFTGMLIALTLLCGIFLHNQIDRNLLVDTPSFLRLIGLALTCLVLARIAAMDPFRAEIVPLVLGAFTATIAFGRPLALLLLTAISLAITLSLGMDLPMFVILSSATASSALWLGRIRTRTKIIYVGAAAACVVGLTTLGVGVMMGQINGVLLAAEAAPNAISPASIQSPTTLLLIEAGRQMGLVILASLLATALLPFIEMVFGVQSDLSLLELGDASHTLLRQLAQRAPGTYNHSINVAAIAEAAADSIGAHGLLTRVGAYFHDIGKMFKPNYFVENQTPGVNRHDSLQPAMSTLVIIAHVKDGSDLARQHRLPRRITDFIEQHHGTTLVEYFYRQAAKKSEEDPNGEEVSELNFRYPGPKPQTLEAAVLMLADAVESASRTLVEPTPMRIQNLVDQIAMKRLLDGQFDDCGLTLRQLDAVKRSLVKSLTAIYHGRIKYPGQQTA